MTDTPKKFVILFNDDQTISLFPDYEKAANAVETIDLDSGEFHYFDCDGIYLKPKYTLPTKKIFLGGIASFSQPGTFFLKRFVSSNAPKIEKFLETHTNLEKNEWFDSLEDLKLAIENNKNE